MRKAEVRKQSSGDPAKHCPLHNKPHPLEKCRTFKAKSLTERKRLLRDFRRCFRCCSATHMAKDCFVELKCCECESDQHCTPLHPGSHFSPALPSACEPDTEQQNNTPPDVTSRCTEVSVEDLPARSCAKICLVEVFPQGQKECSVKMYAILDNQSNRSLTRTEFFQLFDIQGDPSPYLMSMG